MHVQLYSTVLLCCAVPCRSALHCTALHCTTTVLYYTVLYYMSHVHVHIKATTMCLKWTYSSQLEISACITICACRPHLELCLSPALPGSSPPSPVRWRLCRLLLPQPCQVCQPALEGEQAEGEYSQSGRSWHSCKRAHVFRAFVCLGAHTVFCRV